MFRVTGVYSLISMVRYNNFVAIRYVSAIVSEDYFVDALGLVRIKRVIRKNSARAIVNVGDNSLDIISFYDKLDNFDLEGSIGLLEESRLYEGLDISRLDRIVSSGYDKDIHNLCLLDDLSMDQSEDIVLGLFESDGHAPEDYSYIVISLKYNNVELLNGLSVKLGIGSIVYSWKKSENGLLLMADWYIRDKLEVDWFLDLMHRKGLLGFLKKNTSEFIVNEFDSSLMSDYRLIGLVIGDGSFKVLRSSSTVEGNVMGSVRQGFSYTVSNSSEGRRQLITDILECMKFKLGGSGKVTVSSRSIKLEISKNADMRNVREFFSNRLIGSKAEEMSYFDRLYSPSTGKLLKLSNRDRALVVNGIGMVRKDFLTNQELHEDQMKHLAEAYYTNRLFTSKFVTKVQKLFVYYNLLRQGKVKF